MDHRSDDSRATGHCAAVLSVASVGKLGERKNRRILSKIAASKR